MKTVAALVSVLVLVLAAVSCQDDAQVYCGGRLSRTLALLCKNGLIKRSESSFNTADDHVFPWIPAHHANSMHRSKRQVVTECCFKPCTIDELTSYCAQ